METHPPERKIFRIKKKNSVNRKKQEIQNQKYDES